MKKMRKILLGLMGIQIFYFAELKGWDDQPPCYKSLQRYFFKESYLDEAMSFHDYIFQGDWNQIYRDLDKVMQQMPILIKQEAKKMRPDPLEHPFQPQAAGALLHQMLYLALSQTLHAHNITNEGDIKKIFEYVRTKQLGMIEACFGDPKFFN